ncbi:isocitrate lyase/phosphoenolpyruvate mutase family protein [Nereida sp. MMG025]|uniref:isocitrate lyase/PEP mutase family protein n=1 Tax=Nereida sp. MMG025 TaxID=2909981 RepID=UPI001F46B94F|nr:isocitrate lyase/phosphoenolpyruvate mutase family protein [Nereida sp. MMG025]MCF6443516.1 isocitrate lyase/phosphoenolpyruvate mutase family protein [Nereida sp. MMG025]
MTFRAMHRPFNPFVLANAWDAGSAKMLQALGAQAIATSSAAQAFTLGRPDGGTISRDEALAHAQDLIAAVGIPVSGDFENGFGDAPDTCAETVRLSAEIGLAGICIEDIAFPAGTPYDPKLAAERIKAAAAAARAAPQDFFLVARADGIMTGHYDITEAIARIQAFEAAGADGVYVPLPKTMDDLTRICASVSIPVNALAAGPFARYTLSDFAKAGVARVSLGSALARVTHHAIHDAAAAIFGDGTFIPLSHGMAGDAVDALLTAQKR